MKYITLMIITYCVATIFLSNANAEEPNSVDKIIQNTTISSLVYLSYNYDEEEKSNSFLFKRGYLTIQSKLSDMLSVRFTQDITLDEEGSDAGNVEMRLKYLYLKVSLDRFEYLKNTYFEIGLVHRPWLDFEEHIDRYRVQGTMFIERNHLINSADFGVLYSGLIGGKMDEDYIKNVNSHTPGRYGSFAIGIFNGGGYHAIEKNDNKSVEGRLSIRPLPEIIPGFQFGYGFAFGKGNSEENPEFTMNLLYSAFESIYGKAFLQYYAGRGNSKGDMVTPNGSSYFSDGYSLFGEFIFPGTDISALARYDCFNSKEFNNYKKELFLTGASWHFFGHNKLLLDAQKVFEHDNEFWQYEVALEIAF